MEEDQRSCVAVKKLKALHDGKLATDVIFVIGADDEITEEIAAIKSDLVLSSEYFGRLFSSTWTPPNETKIRLRNIDGSTFLLIVEFCTLSGQLVSDVGSLEECLRLARAADEFLIWDLSCLCAQMLEDSFLSVDNVWKVMSKHYQINAITSPCLKFLSSKSEQCLQHPSFMDARCEAVQLFLSLKKMNISSELELLDACLRFLEPHSLPREKFRKYFLPELRLLTLDWEEIKHLCPYLSSEEVACLATFHFALSDDEQMNILPTLCPIRVKRGSSKKTLILVPRRKIVDLRRLFLNEKLVRDLEVGQNVFTLTLCPIRSIAVSAFELICPLSWKYDDYHNQNWLDRLNKAGSFKTNTFLHILSTVTSAKQKSSSKEVQLPEELPMNECSRVDHFALVPAGGTLILTATLNQACVLRDVHLQQEDLNSCNEPRIVETFGRIAATVTNNINYHHQELNDLCIFRKIYFAEV